MNNMQSLIQGFRDDPSPGSQAVADMLELLAPMEDEEHEVRAEDLVEDLRYLVQQINKDC